MTNSLRRLADESDNFHLTWHSDDALYGAYGDGWGFARTDIAKPAIGISRITREPPDLRGLEMGGGDQQPADPAAGRRSGTYRVRRPHNDRAAVPECGETLMPADVETSGRHGAQQKTT